MPVVFDEEGNTLGMFDIIDDRLEALFEDGSTFIVSADFDKRHHWVNSFTFTKNLEEDEGDAPSGLAFVEYSDAQAEIIFESLKAEIRRMIDEEITRLEGNNESNTTTET